MRHVRQRRTAAVLALWAITAAWGRAYAGWDGKTFVSAEWRVELTLPPGWEHSEQASYPGILAFAVERQAGGRMTLAVQAIGSDETARSYAERNRSLLRRIGIDTGGLTPHATGATVLDTVTADGRRRIRQGYVASGGIAYVLTLAAPAEAMRTYARAFDDTLRSMSFREPASTAAPAQARAGDASDSARTPESP